MIWYQTKHVARTVECAVRRMPSAYKRARRRSFVRCIQFHAIRFVFCDWVFCELRCSGSILFRRTHRLVMLVYYIGRLHGAVWCAKRNFELLIINSRITSWKVKMRHNFSSHFCIMEKRRKMTFNRCGQTCRIRENFDEKLDLWMKSKVNRLLGSPLCCSLQIFTTFTALSRAPLAGSILVFSTSRRQMHTTIEKMYIELFNRRRQTENGKNMNLHNARTIISWELI